VCGDKATDAVKETLRTQASPVESDEVNTSPTHHSSPPRSQKPCTLVSPVRRLSSCEGQSSHHEQARRSAHKYSSKHIEQTHSAKDAKERLHQVPASSKGARTATPGNGDRLTTAFEAKNLWKPKKKRMQTPREEGASQTPRTPRTPRRQFQFGSFENARREAELKAQEVFNGVSEDQEKLQQEREQWEADKQEEKNRELEAIHLRNRRILDVQEEFFASVVDQNSVIRMENIPFLQSDDIEKISDCVPDPKKTVQWLQVRWHPDKFMQRFGGLLWKPQQAVILDKVQEVFQMVHEQYNNTR